MNKFHVAVSFLLPAAGLILLNACGSSGTTSDGAGSEIATSAVSGTINNSSGSSVGFNALPELKLRETRFARLLDFLEPVRPAWAAQWSCTGGSLSPAYSGVGSYSFTPLSCSVTWGNGKTASSTWSSTFALAYAGSGCSASSATISSQGAGCTVTRTTGASGNARTVTGPNGNSYTVTHDTNGATSGFSAAVSNSGVILTCGSSGCSGGHSLVISGSHVTGSVTPSGGSATTFWDHTVSTGGGGITVTGSGTSRVVSGSVTVQHNLAKFVSTTTFNSVGHGAASCCFPTTGDVTTTFAGGPNDKKSETLTFSSTCGEATLAQPNGTSVALTLQHCI